MKRTISSMILLLLATTFLRAQEAQNEVATAVEQLRLAMIDGDKTMLESLSAEALSYGHSGGAVENKDEFVDKIVSGKSDFVTIKLDNQTIKLSGDVAIVLFDNS